jgi:hypothetical protein
VPAEAVTRVRVGGVALRARAAVDQPEVLAGGPLTVVWRLRAETGTVHVALGGDRVTGRLAGFSFTGRVQGSDVALTDPAAGSVDLGGPIGTHEVGAAEFSVPLLVNDFLTLDAARDAVPPGETRELELGCRWDLRAGDAATVLGAAPVPLQVTLRVPLRRDDTALAVLHDPARG